MRRAILCALVGWAALAGPGQAADEAPYRVTLTAGSKPQIDGRVTAGEYAGSFTEPKTGIKVSWQSDGQVLDAALESPSNGWVAVGLGARGMNSSTMIIGFTDPQGQWQVEEHLGRSLYRHKKVDQPRLLKAVARPVEGRTVLEFTLPLSLSNGRTIEPGKPMPFVLSMHKSKSKMSKHSKTASLVLELATEAGRP